MKLLTKKSEGITNAESNDMQSNSFSPEYQIPKGSVQILVRGGLYAQKLLTKVTVGMVAPLSITPLTEKQLNSPWPEKGSFNVNLFGSTESDDSNWLGYINPKLDKTADFSQLLKENTKVAIYGRVEYSCDYFELLFLLPSQLMRNDLTEKEIIQVINETSEKSNTSPT